MAYNFLSGLISSTWLRDLTHSEVAESIRSSELTKQIVHPLRESVFETAFRIEWHEQDLDQNIFCISEKKSETFIRRISENISLS